MAKLVQQYVNFGCALARLTREARQRDWIMRGKLVYRHRSGWQYYRRWQTQKGGRWHALGRVEGPYRIAILAEEIQLKNIDGEVLARAVAYSDGADCAPRIPNIVRLSRRHCEQRGYHP